MTPFPPAEPFDRQRHRTNDFSCGQPALDAWVQRYAGQGQRRDTARTFVTARADGSIAGYYTLIAGQVDRPEATDAVGAGTSPRFPIPICFIARLAVDGAEQGKGLGADLLLDALERIVVASEFVGMRGVVVHALDRRAARFYERFAFKPLPVDPLTLMVPLSSVRSVLRTSTSTQP